MSLILLSSDTVAAPLIPAYGPSVVATLLLDLESGAKISYEWATDLGKSWSGLEQRTPTIGMPRITVDGIAMLVDGDDRTYRTKLLQYAAKGSAFLLGLPHESLTLSADTAGAVVVVNTTYADWTQPGQRVVVIDRDGVVTNRNGYVVQSSTSTTITLDSAPAAHNGGVIMPATAVYLDAQQGLGRHLVNVTEWHVSARAAEFGYAGVDSMGTSSMLATYGDTGGSFIVWDRHDIDNMAEDSLQSMSEIVDLGGVPLGVGSAVVPDWGRQVKSTGSFLEWQWLKAFFFATVGRCRKFLLPTWRPDFVWLSTVGTTITVQSATYSGDNDVIAWLTSTPHPRVLLANATDFGDYNVYPVGGWVDNLDGTTTIDVGSPTDANPTIMCRVELVRWESDKHEPSWHGDVYSFTALARVVQQ